MTNYSNTLLTAIDIGSSGIRMDIAEVKANGAIHRLESLKKGVQLGRDAFTNGHLSEESIRAACLALQDFKKVMDSYGVNRYRAVATSAVRESSNSDTFLDRVLMSTGLDVETIDGSEETRLTYSGVVETLRELPDALSGPSLLVEIGGGSADVTLIRNGKPEQSGTFPVGPVRQRVGARSAAGTQDQTERRLKRQIASLLASVKRSIPLKEAEHYVGIGGDVRFVSRALKRSKDPSGNSRVSQEVFARYVDSVARLTTDELVKKHALSYHDAENLVPALMTYLQLLRETKSEKMIVSRASIRSGILQDLAPGEKDKKIKRLATEIISAAQSLGRKYQYDENHAERVREVSELLFDHLKKEHRLSDTQGLYLQVAALLHDIGLFISHRGHHKHSHYLISTSDLFGLRRKELEIIANIARYHRKALPGRTHVSFVSLDRDQRVVVSKMAAILRIANILAKEGIPTASNLHVANEGDQIVIVAERVSDFTTLRVALSGRSNLFSEVFGKKIVLREAQKTL